MVLKSTFPSHTMRSADEDDEADADSDDEEDEEALTDWNLRESRARCANHLIVWLRLQSRSSIVVQ